MGSMDSKLNVCVMMDHTMRQSTPMTRSSTFLPKEQNTSSEQLFTNSSLRDQFFIECSKRLTRLKTLGARVNTVRLQTSSGRKHYNMTILRAGFQSLHFYGNNSNESYRNALVFMCTEEYDDLLQNMTN